MLDEIRKELKALENKEKAQLLQKFFKTGKGEYGEGDIFLGLTVPQVRIVAKKYKDLSLGDLEKLITSKIHEERQAALMILVLQFKKASEEKQKEICKFYLAHTKYVNNWDLVDGSAGYIVGEWIYSQCQMSNIKFPISNKHVIPAKAGIQEDRSRLGGRDDVLKILEDLAHSHSLWERRIAIIATFAFIYHGIDIVAYLVVQELVHDKNDLIQKAVGWMLREAGKRVSREREEEFLKKHYKSMGRTALRYAIEHFPENTRKAYLQGKI